jgi:hypothetical protein
MQQLRRHGSHCFATPMIHVSTGKHFEGANHAIQLVAQQNVKLDVRTGQNGLFLVFFRLRLARCANHENKNVVFRCYKHCSIESILARQDLLEALTLQSQCLCKLSQNTGRLANIGIADGSPGGMVIVPVESMLSFVGIVVAMGDVASREIISVYSGCLCGLWNCRSTLGSKYSTTFSCFVCLVQPNGVHHCPLHSYWHCRPPRAT